MTTALVRPARSILWELRGAWASGRRVSLSLEADEARVEGHVQRVSATGAFVVVRGLHVPADSVLAVHHPSRLGDSAVGEDERWRGRRYREPQSERLPLTC